ncbi:MAG: hypothetical protein CBC09_04090 [Cellvibrionales bacterium TMED49]|nr:hypothetical protein [Porticoccaceae bacterium]OUU38998.1 MAG: hypothetical protein CBC09_04090 [Cellvibrionales bacterium TMED49]|tara:strand:+ start:147 stop:983 length:837 start_codon:yes stop_codon:yes gene_type:complete
MLRSVDLCDYMQNNPIKIGEEDSISEAVSLILEHRVSGLCVVDASDKLLGVLSEMDCLKVGLSGTHGTSDNTEIRSYMQPYPVKIFPENDLFVAVNSIIENRVSGLCVVNRQEKLIGVLSEMDCLRVILSAIYNDHREVGKVKEHMTEAIESCDVNANLLYVAEDMLKKGRRRRPVINKGRLIGQITCRQILKRLYQKEDNVEIVKTHMNNIVESCELRSDIVGVSNDMVRKGRRRRPVVEQGRLVGQITCRQLLKVISDFNRNQVAANFDPMYRDLL